MSFRLGYFLVHEGTLTVDQVDRAFRRQQRLGDTLDTHLLALGWLDLPTLQQALLDAHAAPEPKKSWLAEPMKEALESVPPALVEQFHMLPIARDAHALHLLAPDHGPPPEHLPLAYWLDCPIQVYPAPQVQLLEGIERLYGFPIPTHLRTLQQQHSSASMFAAPTGWQTQATEPTPAKSEAPTEIKAISAPAPKAAPKPETQSDAKPKEDARENKPKDTKEKARPKRRRRAKTQSQEIPSPEDGQVPSVKMPAPRSRMTPPPATRAPLTLPPLDRLRSAFRPQEDETPTEDSDNKTKERKPEDTGDKAKKATETAAKEAKSDTPAPDKPETEAEAAPPTPPPSKEAEATPEPAETAEAKEPTEAPASTPAPKTEAAPAQAPADTPPSEDAEKQPLPFPDTKPSTSVRTADTENDPEPEPAEEAETPKETPKETPTASTKPPRTSTQPLQDIRSREVPIPTKNGDASQSPNTPPPSLSAQLAAVPQITPSSPGIPLLARDFHEAMTIPGLPAFPPLTTDPAQPTLIPGAPNGNNGQVAIRNHPATGSQPAQEAVISLTQPIQDFLGEKNPAARKEKLDALIPYGGTIVPPILEHIPPTEQLNDKNPETQETIERIVEICRQVGDPAVYRLLQILEKEEQPQRMRALLLLGEWLPSRAIAPLLQRLFTEKDPIIQRMVRNNLRGYRKRTEFHKLLQFLRDNLRSNDQHRLQKAIFFLGDLRIAEAVPDLIELLTHDDTTVRESALFALRNLALQDHGNNIRGWQEWHNQFAHLDRKHWVVHALNHNEKAIRHLAKEELRVEFGDDFGYDPKATTAEREAVQKLAGLWLQSN